MSAKYKSPSFLLPNEINTNTNPLNTDGNPATGTGINSLYSMEFNGSSDYIDVGNPTELQLTGAFSVSFWMKTNITGSRAFVSKDSNTSNPRGFSVEMSNSAPGGYFVVYNGTTAYGVYVYSSDANYVNIRDNNWHHITAVYTPSTSVALFIDGNFVKSNTTNIPASVNFVNNNLNIGRRPQSGGANYHQGELDEVAIFNRALESTEIAALYGGTSPNIYPSNLMATDLNPIAYYPLGEQAQNTGYLDPSNPGSDIAGSEWQFPNGVLQDYVMDFDGSTDYIDAGSSAGVIGTDISTFSMWLKTSNTGGQTILSTRNQSTDDGWVVQITSTTVQFFNEKNNKMIYTTLSPTLSNGSWHNVVIIRGGSTAANAIYVDGNPINLTINTEDGTSPQSSSNLSIGSTITSSSTPGFFNGELSNIAIWNSNQSANIANIYNNGSPQTTYTVTPQNWWKLNADSVYTPSAPNYTKALSFTSPDLISINSPITIDTTQPYSISAWVHLDSTGNQTIIAGNTSGGTSDYVVPLIFKDVSGSFAAIATHQENSSGVFRQSNNIAKSELTSGWNHIVLVKDGVNCSFFYNGQPYGTASFSTTPPATIELTTIGKGFNNWYLNGRLSNLAIFDSGLTSSQVSTLFNFGTPETNISFSPQAWWKLDDQTAITDSSGNGNTGTNNGATDATTSVAVVPSWKIPSALPIATPNYTTALDFDAASSDYIDTNSTFNTLTSFSISAWFKADDTAGTVRSIVSTRVNGITTSKGFDIYISANVLTARVYNNGATEVVQSFTDTTSWHNVVMTYNGTTLELFLDNSSIGTATGNFINSGGRNLTIGKWGPVSGASYYFDGFISNVSIWNTALTSTQVSTLYNNGTPETAISFSPVSWWKLDTGGSTITDYGSGGNNGTNSSPGATQVTSDVLAPQPVNGVSTTLPSTALQQSDLQFDSPYSNYSLSFDGTTGIQCGDIPQLNSATKLSFNVWLNYENMVQRIIFSKEDSTNAIRLYNWTSGILYFWLKNSGTGTVSYVNNFSSLVNLNEWNMLTVVYDGTQTSNNDRVKIFLNGGSSNILTNYGTIPTSTGNITDSFAIGEYSSASGNKFLGKLDETSIFNTALTSAEILEIYNNGRPKDLTTFSGTAPISWWRLGENAYFQDTTLVLPNSITGAPNGEAATNNIEMISADAPGTYANGIGTNLDILDRVGDAPLSTSNSQSYNMIPSDKVPYVPGYVGLQTSNIYSMSFNGVDEYIETNYTGLNGLSQSTISIWANTSNVTLGRFLYGNRDTSSNGVACQTWTDGNIYFYVSSASSLIFNMASAGIQNNQWFNLVFVFDGSQSSNTNKVKIYVNKNLIAYTTSTTFPTTLQTSSKSFKIGNDEQANAYWNGKIDEVAIFDKALTADQVNFDLYQPSLPAGSNKTADIANNPNLPTPVAWYRMGD